MSNTNRWFWISGNHNEILAKAAAREKDLKERIEKLNGTDRSTSTTSQSSPAQQPNSCAGGSNPQSPGLTFISTAASQNTSQGASLAQAQQRYQQMMQLFTNAQDYRTPNLDQKTPSGKWCPPWMYGELGKPNAAKEWIPHKEAIDMKSGSVKAGEIVAWRAWYWDQQAHRLRSLFVDYEWPIKKPAFGEPWKGYGLHAFKSYDLCYAEYRVIQSQLVFGQAALWGDVMEFELGYTAEFGKPVHFFSAPDEYVMKEVTELYL